jgi:transcriptional regulator with XRE-family HTH domain
VSNELARHRIHDHRVRLGLSPEQFALRIGVSGMTVRRVEKGYTPFLSTQQKFAAALDITHTDLFGMPDIPVHYLEQRVKDELELRKQIQLAGRRRKAAA